MPTNPRSLFLAMALLTGPVCSSSSAAEPFELQSAVPLRTVVHGTFAHYLKSPNGDIDGIVLTDDTVARFAPVTDILRTAPFRPGDPVRVEGDLALGIAGRYLVHALVTAETVSIVEGARLALRSTRKPPGSSTARTSKSDPVKVGASPSVRARRNGRFETIGTKVRAVTTGKGKPGSYSKWSRTQETAGP